MPLDLQGVIDGEDDCLYLHNQTLGEAEAVADALHNNTTMTRLVLSNVGLSDGGMQNLEGVLLNRRNAIDDVDISFQNELGQDGITALANVIRDSTEIIDLRLSFPHNQKGVECLFQALRFNSSITTFCFHDTHQLSGIQPYAALGQALLLNSTLTTLILQRNEIGDEGVKLLGPSLTRSNTLTRLAIHGDAVGDIGFQVLAESLQHNTMLKTLELTGNSIHMVPGMSMLLMNNSTLTHLKLDVNSIDDDGADRIASGLCLNTALTYLDLNNNLLTSDGMESMADALSDENCTLQELQLFGNEAGDSGARSFAHCLRSNETLLTLGLCGEHGITDFGAEELLCAVKENSKIQELTLDGCEISNEIIEEIDECTLTNRMAMYNKLAEAPPKASDIHVRSLLDDLQKEAERFPARDLKAKFKKKEGALLQRIEVLVKSDESKKKEIEELQEALQKMEDRNFELQREMAVKCAAIKLLASAAPVKRRKTRITKCSS